MFVAFYICTFLMSFVYIPIPGFSSVREETQLHAALPAAHRVRGGDAAPEPEAGGSPSTPARQQPPARKGSVPRPCETFLQSRLGIKLCSLSFIFLILLLLFLATCTFLTKFIVAIKVFYFPIHIYSCIESMRSKAT